MFKMFLGHTHWPKLFSSESTTFELDKISLGTHIPLHILIHLVCLLNNLEHSNNL